MLVLVLSIAALAGEPTSPSEQAQRWAAVLQDRALADRVSEHRRADTTLQAAAADAQRGHRPPGSIPELCGELVAIRAPLRADGEALATLASSFHRLNCDTSALNIAAHQTRESVSQLDGLLLRCEAKRVRRRRSFVDDALRIVGKARFDDSHAKAVKRTYDACKPETEGLRSE